MIPIFISARTPGADNTVEWTPEVYKNKRFVWINYDINRWVSRWVAKERKRKFSVSTFYHDRHGKLYGGEIGYYTTLKAARKVAEKYVADRAKEAVALVTDD